MNNAKKKSFGSVQRAVFIINESLPVAPVFLEIGVCTVNTECGIRLIGKMSCSITFMGESSSFVELDSWPHGNPG